MNSYNAFPRKTGEDDMAYAMRLSAFEEEQLKQKQKMQQHQQQPQLSEQTRQKQLLPREPGEDDMAYAMWLSAFDDEQLKQKRKVKEKQKIEQQDGLGGRSRGGGGGGGRGHGRAAVRPPPRGGGSSNNSHNDAKSTRDDKITACAGSSPLPTKETTTTTSESSKTEHNNKNRNRNRNKRDKGHTESEQVLKETTKAAHHAGEVGRGSTPELMSDPTAIVLCKQEKGTDINIASSSSRHHVTTQAATKLTDGMHQSSAPSQLVPPVSGVAAKTTQSSSHQRFDPECSQRQLDEVTFLTAMYTVEDPDGLEAQLEVLRTALSEYDLSGGGGGGSDVLSSPSFLPPPRLNFSICVTETVPGIVGNLNKNNNDGDEDGAAVSGVVVDDGVTLRCSLRVTLPLSYPAGVSSSNTNSNSSSDPEWHFDAPSKITKIEYDAVVKSVREVVCDPALAGMERLSPMVETARETLVSMRRESAEEELQVADDIRAAEAAAEASWEEALDAETCLGRRAIYYHHIRSEAKRMFIARWARKLRLNGYCKIGYPGMLVVEGPEVGVVQYVAMLQRLRWKHMVVRGEDRIPIDPQQQQHQQLSHTKRGGGSSTSSSSSSQQMSAAMQASAALDSVRRITDVKGVMETTDASEIAARCRGAGLEELFLTSLKIYK